MRELLEMMKVGAGAEVIYLKMTELYQSGELEAASELIDAALLGTPNLSYLAEKYRNAFGECDIGTWYKLEENFWVKKVSDNLAKAVAVYPNSADCFLCYYLEADLPALTGEKAEACCKACPAPENLQNKELCRLYSVMRSLPLMDAKERFATESDEMKNLWLKKHGISKEDEL